MNKPKIFVAKRGNEILRGTVVEIADKIGYADTTIHQACYEHKRLDGWTVSKVEYHYIGYVNDRVAFGGGMGDLIKWLSSVGTMTYLNGDKITIESEW